MTLLKGVLRSYDFTNIMMSYDIILRNCHDIILIIQETQERPCVGKFCGGGGGGWPFFYYYLGK